MITRTFQNTKVARDRERITAICLLEQECALIRAFPETVVPVKRRIVGGQDWVIRCDARGEKLVECRMSAERGGRRVVETFVYVAK